MPASMSNCERCKLSTQSQWLPFSRSSSSFRLSSPRIQNGSTVRNRNSRRKRVVVVVVVVDMLAIKHGEYFTRKKGGKGLGFLTQPSHSTGNYNVHYSLLILPREVESGRGVGR